MRVCVKLVMQSAVLLTLPKFAGSKSLKTPKTKDEEDTSKYTWKIKVGQKIKLTHIKEDRIGLSKSWAPLPRQSTFVISI